MNDRNRYGAFRARAFRLPGWQIAIFGALAAALIITLAIVATGVFLLAFPAILVLDWVYRRRFRGGARPATPGQTRRDTVITADYEVLPPDAANRDPR